MEDTRDSSPFLDTYLPLDRRRALAQGRDLPDRSSGSALFADLSGFTPLMEHLSNTLGPQQGAEELTHLLNALFALLIGEVHAHGGSVVAFGGDALTCWFPGPVGETALRSASCALAMQRYVDGFGPVETPAGPIRFSVRVGIASGQTRRFVVGQPPHGRCDVLAGATLDRMAAAEGRAGTGQVVMDTTTAASLPIEAWRPLEEGFAVLVPAPTLTVSPRPDDRMVAPPPLPIRRVRRWLAEPLYRRLQASRGGFAAELRLVASLFVQFAGLDYDGDPDAGRRLQQYVVLAQEHLAAYEGYIALVSCGDKGSLLYVLFGAPIAHEDDPERATGFALEFRQAAGGLPFIQGQRIGISLGRVYAGILGSPQRCTYTVLGDEVNVSARLMQAAQGDQILVSQRVRQTAAAAYTFRALGTVSLKGKEEPVPVFEPVAPQDHRPGAEIEQLVGREQELATMARLLVRVEAGAGQALLLLGEAGVGKTALVRELLRQAQERGWKTYIGACLSYGQSTPYLPWRAILEQLGRLAPEMESAERVACLERVVAELPDPPERPGYWRARFPLLAEAMGLEVPDTHLTRSLEGELRRDNTFQLLEALIRGLAVPQPAVVVLEDAYWADELSLALAAHIGRGLANIPLLLALVHRPFTAPVPATVQALQRLPHQETLTLPVLEPSSALELARQHLQGTILPPRLEALLQERAQGNPFFIEELLRALQEAGCLRRRNGAVELAGDWEDLELPDTIEGVVRARMDRMAEGERLTLKVAAVIGRTFQRPLLHAVHPARPGEPTLGHQLARLGRANFTQLEEPAPEWRYAFRHPILHEVTYETLLFAQRRQLHGAIGAVLEEWHGNDLPRFLDLLAHHYARSEAREKAVHYLQRAADKARREYANEVALTYYSQALERLLPEERALRYELLAGRERIHDLLGERGAQEEDLLTMDRLAQELADPKRQIEVLNRRTRRAADMGRFEEGEAMSRKALPLAQQAGYPLGQAEAHKNLGMLRMNLGDYEGARESYRLAVESYRAMGHQEGESRSLNNLGLVSYYQGDLDQALHYYRRALEMARQLDNRRWEGLVLDNIGLTHLQEGDYEQARVHSEQAMAIFQEIGDLPGQEIALINVGAIAIVQGDLAVALSSYRQALEQARRLQDPEGEATSLANLGLVSAYQEHMDQARHLLNEALRQYGTIGHRRGEATILHYLGLVELWSGNAPAAQALLQQALTLRQEIGEPGNALISQAWLGLAYLAAGAHAQARTCLEEALAQLEIEAHGGTDPDKEIWLAAYRIWQACGEETRARAALDRAHHMVQEQAGRIGDPYLQRSFLENVPVNREILCTWKQVHEQTATS